MKQSVIGEIYSTWSKMELKKLNKFITTSHWSRSETIVHCHQCLAAYAAKDKLDDLNKEVLFQSTYPHDDYNDSKLRFTLNRLLEAIKEFILLEENEKKNIHSEKIWMDFIQNKKLKKNILYNIENEFTPANSLDRYLFSYYKSFIEGSYQFQFSSNVEVKFNSLISMSKKAAQFSDYVFLRQYCLLITFSNIYKSSELQIAESKFVEIKENASYMALPEFQTYIALIEMLHSTQHEDYFQYKDLVFKNLALWDNEDKINFISFLLNYSTAQINKGHVKFIDEQYELFLIFEEQNIFNIPNYINNTKINNVIHIFLRKKDYERAEDFIKRYAEMLGKDTIDSCRHFNLARIRFEKSLYKDSLRELLQVDFGRDAFYSINSKVLLLKNYYELRESDAFASLITSFKEYIKKNKIVSETHKTSILNYLRIVDKIYAVTSGKVKKLEEEIKNHTQIVEKNWLLDKIAEKIK